MLCTGCAKQGWSLAKGSAKARRQCQGKAKSLRSVSSVWSLANGSLETRTKMIAWPRLRLAGRKKMCKGCSKQAEPWQTAAPRQGGSVKARLSFWEAFQAFEAWQTAVSKLGSVKARSVSSVWSLANGLSRVWSLANGSVETRTKMTAWPRLRLDGEWCARAGQSKAPRQGGSAKARLSLWEAFQAFEAWQTAVTKPEQKCLPDPG